LKLYYTRRHDPSPRSLTYETTPNIDSYPWPPGRDSTEVVLQKS